MWVELLDIRNDEKRKNINHNNGQSKFSFQPKSDLQHMPYYEKYNCSRHHRLLETVHILCSKFLHVSQFHMFPQNAVNLKGHISLNSIN